MPISAGTSEITCLGQVAITVQEVDRALAFYRDKLGLKFLFQAGTLAFFDCGGVRLMLSRPERLNPYMGTRFSISKCRISTMPMPGCLRRESALKTSRT